MKKCKDCINYTECEVNWCNIYGHLVGMDKDKELEMEYENCMDYKEDAQMKKEVKVIITNNLEDEGVVLADKVYEIEVDGEMDFDGPLGFKFTEEQAALAQEQNIDKDLDIEDRIDGVTLVTEGYYISYMDRQGATYYRMETEEELIAHLISRHI